MGLCDLCASSRLPLCNWIEVGAAVVEAEFGDGGQRTVGRWFAAAAYGGSRGGGESGLEEGREGGLTGGMGGAVTRTFHYTLRAPDGRVIDTSQGAEPISFVEGSGMIIDGLEEALREMAVGAKARVVVPAARAYGERDEDQVQPVLRALLPVAGELKPGDNFQVGDDAQAPTVTVVSVQGEMVVLDGNHPLAGVDLTFEVEVVAVTAGS